MIFYRIVARPPWARVLLCLLALGWMGGCANAPSVEQQMAERAANAALSAAQLDAQGQKYAALQQWLLVDVLDSNHPTARQRATQLEGELASEAQDLLQQALSARKKRRYRTARKLLLQGLALEPHHPEIRRLLQQREAERYIAELKKKESTPLSPTESIARAAGERQPSVPTDATLREAEVIYQQAIDAIAVDQTQARQLFEKVLAIEPTHLGARAYLDILR